MSTREEILTKVRANIRDTYDMPDVKALKAVTYGDPVAQFIAAAEASWAQVVELKGGDDVNALIRSLYPEAKVFASNIKGIQADRNPDTVPEAADLNGTDVGIVRGEVGVAENACVWIPQTMKEKVVCFISEYLVILLDRKTIVNNMHEAYRRIRMTDYGYGTFISGPSKTADIAQALVMGAQAARGVTILLG